MTTIVCPYKHVHEENGGEGETERDRKRKRESAYGLLLQGPLMPHFLAPSGAEAAPERHFRPPSDSGACSSSDQERYVALVNEIAVFSGASKSRKP